MGIVEGRILSLHPLDKSLDLFVFQQPFHGVEVPCQLLFAEDGMNLVVADSMHAHGFLAAVAAWNQMMFIDGRAGNQSATA